MVDLLHCNRSPISEVYSYTHFLELPNIPAKSLAFLLHNQEVRSNARTVPQIDHNLFHILLNSIFNI
jgi:hypothetical protein